MLVAQLSALIAAAVYVHRSSNSAQSTLDVPFTHRTLHLVALEIPEFVKDYTDARGCLVADPEGDHADLTLML